MESPNHYSTTPNREQLPPSLVVIFMLLLIFLFSMFGSIILYGIADMRGISLDNIMSLLHENSTVGDRNLMRTILFINHLTTFILPGLVLTFFIYKWNWNKELQLHKAPYSKNIVLGSLFLFVALPLVQFTFWLNKQIPLPEWAMQLETDIGDSILFLLQTEAPYELFFNIFIIAIIPAIGEEIIFRGILQKNIQKALKNPHLSIFIAGFLFSLMHLQFQGFIPRMLLGMLLGYLFYWTNNLWIPIITHFFNNALQVVAYHLYEKKVSNINIDEIDSVPLWLAVVSLALVVGIGHLIQNGGEKKEKLLDV